MTYSNFFVHGALCPRKLYGLLGIGEEQGPGRVGQGMRAQGRSLFTQLLNSAHEANGTPLLYSQLIWPSGKVLGW